MKNDKKILILFTILTLALFITMPNSNLTGFYFLKLQKEQAETIPFNITITIPGNYSTVSPGEEFLFSIKLTNFGSTKRADVYLDYWIQNTNGKKIFNAQETVAVETKASFTREITLPTKIEEGSYRVFAQVSYGEKCISTKGKNCKNSVSNTPFTINTKKTNNIITNEMFLITIIVSISAFIVLGIFSFRKKINKQLMIFKTKRKVHEIVYNKLKNKR